MTRAEAIDHLPSAYQQIVTFVDAGVSEQEMAQKLDVDPEAVGPLITVAMAKLDRLLLEPSHS